MTDNLYKMSDEVITILDNTFDLFNKIRGREIPEDLKSSFKVMIEDVKTDYKPWKSIYVLLLASLELKDFDEEALFIESIAKTIKLEESIIASDLKCKRDIMALAFYMAAKHCEEDSLDSEHEVDEDFNARALYMVSYEYGLSVALINVIRCSMYGLDGDIDLDMAKECIELAEKEELESAPVFAAVLKYFELLLDEEDFSFDMFDSLDFDINTYDLRLLLANELYRLGSYIESGHIPLDNPFAALATYYAVEKLGATEVKYDIERIYTDNPELREFFNGAMDEFSEKYKTYRKSKEN